MRESRVSGRGLHASDNERRANKALGEAHAAHGLARRRGPLKERLERAGRCNGGARSGGRGGEHRGASVANMRADGAHAGETQGEGWSGGGGGRKREKEGAGAEKGEEARRVGLAEAAPARWRRAASACPRWPAAQTPDAESTKSTQ
eukprot:3799987-Pleurochrysis_carterae.AAC.3